MTDRTPNTSNSSSFFASPTPTPAPARPPPSSSHQPSIVQTPNVAPTAAFMTANQQLHAPFTGTATASSSTVAGGAALSTVGPVLGRKLFSPSMTNMTQTRGAHTASSSDYTPLVGNQLSFTPALTQTKQSGANVGRLPFSTLAAPTPAATSTLAFSTTPSLAVPLGEPGSVIRKPPPAPANTAFQYHLPAFGAHASLPGGLIGLTGNHANLPPLPQETIIIDREPLRNLVATCVARGHAAGAVFYADKLATLEQYSTSSVYILADAYARSRYWSRAVHLLKKHSMIQLPYDIEDNFSDAELRMKALYLGLQCLLEMKQYEEALNVCLLQDNHTLEFDDNWLNETDKLLASVVPTNDSDATLDAQVNMMKEIIGKDELTLITQLYRFQAYSQLQSESQQQQTGASRDLSLASSLAYLRGHFYELQSNKYHAILWYKLALKFDVCNFEAFQRLTSKRLLTSTEELAFTLSLQFPEEMQWLKYIWLNRIDVEKIDDAHETTLDQDGVGLSMGRGVRGDGLLAPTILDDQTNAMDMKEDNEIALSTALGTLNQPTTTPPINKSSSSVITKPPPTAATLLQSSSISSLLYRYRLLSITYGFGSNADLLQGIIEYKYNCGQYRETYELINKIMEYDPFNLEILPTYLCTLVEMKMSAELFQVSHKLVEAYPTHAIAWFSVGCYYFLLRKFDLARRFFYKSTRFDAFFSYAWLGFGHTFSFTDQTDQALLSYRTAHRLFEGNSLPLLYIGMEYLKTNNFILAQNFLEQSIQYNPYDPLPYNELGIIYYKNQAYPDAIKMFLKCLSLVKQEVLENWESTLFNLGHSYRKVGSYMEALTAYNRCLSVSQRHASTIVTAIGFTYHLLGNLNHAIDYYHKALGLNARDTFTIDMLDRALKEVFEEGSMTIEGI